MKINLLFVLILVAFVTTAQTTCDCKANFDTLTAKIRNNYAGYFDRIKMTGEVAHNNAFNVAQKKAIAAKTPKACFRALMPYVRYYKDAHLGFTYLTDTDFDFQFNKINLTTFQSNLKKTPLSSIEGIWQNTDANMTLAIVKDATQKGTFKAVVINSSSDKYKDGLIYCTLKGANDVYRVTFFNAFSSAVPKAKKKGNTLYLDDKLWVRQAPFVLQKSDVKRIEAYKKIEKGLFFDKLDTDVAYLKIESFANNDAEVDAFVKKQDAVIRQTPYLIVDLRGNGGGSTGWISIVPYIYTNIIKQGKTHVRLSADNTPVLKQNIKGILDMDISPDMKRYFTDEFMANKKKEYEQLAQFQGSFFPTEGVSIPMDSVLTYPKKVALLVDEGTGSSCEHFFQLSKQSTKTITFGRNTMGIMDYVGQSNPTALPFQAFYLSIPTEKSDWTTQYLTNPKGMKPDVLLDPLDEDAWIDYVIQYFKKGNKI